MSETSTDITFTPADYLEIRQRGIALNDKILNKLSKDDFKECARHLKVWHQKSLTLNDESELNLFMDYAIYAYRPHGINWVQKYQRLYSQKLDAFEKGLLQHMANARYAIYQISSTNHENTLQATDIFSKISYPIVDYQMAKSTPNGGIFAGHLIDFNGFFIQSGGVVMATKEIMESDNVAAIIDSIKDEEVGEFLNHPKNASKMARAIVTTAFQLGQANRIRHQ